MKYVFNFFAGWFLAFLLGAGYLFFFKKSTMPLDVANVLTLSGSTQVQVAGTIALPENLKSMATEKGALLVLVIREKGIPALLSTAYYHDFAFPLPFKQTFLHESGDGGVLIKFRYCPNFHEAEACGNQSALPRIEGTSPLLAVDSAKGKILDLGTIQLTQKVLQAGSEACLSQTKILSGTISPTPEFQKSSVGKKYSLVVMPAPSLERDREIPLRALENKIENIAHQIQAVDFSRGPLNFSVPFPANIPRSAVVQGRVRVYAVECGPNEDAVVCARKLWPISEYQKLPAGIRLLQTSGNVLPYCGMENLNFVIGEK